MKLFKTVSVVSAVMSVSLLSVAAQAKDFKKMVGTTQNGKMTEPNLEIVSTETAAALDNMSGERIQEVVENPKRAVSNEERLAIMAARQIFIVVDKSGSMTSSDLNPTLDDSNSRSSTPWTRWDSARVATESISELAISMDKDQKVEMIFFPSGNSAFDSRFTFEDASTVAHIQSYFQTHAPSGGTPLAEALEHLRAQRLNTLLNDSEPFTVLIMTDGSPNDPNRVKEFFANLIKDHRLHEENRQYLAAFSFIQMGDDSTAERFLADLDDNMKNFYKSKGVTPVDIIDTKKDNFLFGTGPYKGRSQIGPFAVMWDALFD